MSFVHESALLLGEVIIEEGCFIGPYCVIRLDEEEGSFRIGRNSNLQDHVVIHASGNGIGEHCNIAHHAIIHGSQIGDQSTIYIKSVIDHAIIESGCFVDAGCYIKGVVIPKNSYVPPHSVIVSDQDLVRIQPMNDTFREVHEKVNKHNREHALSYLKE